MSQRLSRRAHRDQAVPARRTSRFGGSRREWWIAAASVAVAGALIAGIVVARSGGRSAQATPAAAAAKGALDFSGTDPVTGKHVSLADYPGRPIVLNVWGSWCGPCNAEAPDLRRFAAAHPGAQVIGIDLQDTRSGARAFYKRYGWTHPSIFDPNGDIAFRLGLTGTPTTYFLDRGHRIVTQIVGATDLAGFDRGLTLALARGR